MDERAGADGDSLFPWCRENTLGSLPVLLAVCCAGAPDLPLPRGPLHSGAGQRRPVERMGLLDSPPCPVRGRVRHHSGAASHTIQGQAPRYGTGSTWEDWQGTRSSVVGAALPCSLRATSSEEQMVILGSQAGCFLLDSALRTFRQLPDSNLFP